jgi:hypothetical protein
MNPIAITDEPDRDHRHRSAPVTTNGQDTDLPASEQVEVRVLRGVPSGLCGQPAAARSRSATACPTRP